MKSKIISLLLAVSVISTLVVSPVFAQNSVAPDAGISFEVQQKMDSVRIMPVPGGGVMPFSGQNHNYSLVFRGNGESIVTLRVALTNTDPSKDLTQVELRIPKGVDPKDLSVYQIIAQPPCIRYEERPIVMSYPYTPKCVEYGEPDYYYYYGNGKYQQAKAEVSGDTLKIDLPTSIKPNKTGSYFVYFRGFGYAQKTLFGAYKYDFESLKVNDQINQMNIGISTDSDLFLKGVKGEVGYRQESSVAMKALPAADAGAVANPTVDRFVSQIGYGQINKQVTNLAELESYKLEGMFADSRSKLYGREILTVLGLILLSLALLATIFVILRRKFFMKAGTDKPVAKSGIDSNLGNILIMTGVSFSSSLVTAGYTLAVYAIANALNDLVDYQFQAIVMILLVVISFAVYVFILIGPSLLVGFKRGLSWGMGTFAMTIVWMVVMAILMIGVLFIFRNQNFYPPVMPYTKTMELDSSGSGAVQTEPARE